VPGSGEAGFYTYQSYMHDSGRTPAAAIGAGVNLTIYFTNADKFFPGQMKYASYVIGPFSWVFSQDPCSGKLTCVTVSLMGKGFGWLINSEGSNYGSVIADERQLFPF
jgi:hypothetical protein